jgi:pentatricopeptide repeat protein
MKSNGCVPNIISYNGVFASLSEAGEAGVALSIFRKMKSDHLEISPNFNTFLHLAGAVRKLIASEEEKVALLWRIYGTMTRRDRRVLVGGSVLESLITSYGALMHFDEAEAVFNSIAGTSDASCLRAILFACSQASPPRWETALALLHSSDIVGKEDGPGLVDPGALCNAMLACSKADRWEEALQLLRLYGGENVSIVAVNSLIAACGRAGRADMAMEMINEMEDFGVSPDRRSYRSAMIACNQAQREQQRSASSTKTTPGGFAWWECALSLLRRMKEHGFRPDTFTLSSAISACESAGRWQLALKILQSTMDECPEDDEEFGLNMYCWNTAIAACEKGGAWVEALEIYERMKAQRGRQLRPNIVTVSCLVLALEKSGQRELAVDIYDEGIKMRYFLRPWVTSYDGKAGSNISAIDLHSFSAAMARTSIRSYLNALTDAGDKLIHDDLTIIVGKGLHSVAEPILKNAVQELLLDEYGIAAETDDRNEGRLIVRSRALTELASRGSE